MVWIRFAPTQIHETRQMTYTVLPLAASGIFKSKILGFHGLYRAIEIMTDRQWV